MRKSRAARRLALATLLIAVGASAFATSGFGQLGGDGTITANRYVITIDGYQVASFQELSGLTTEVEAAEFVPIKDGQVQINKLVGKLKPPTITLKHGMTNALDMWGWHEQVRQGRPDARRSAQLTAFNAEGQPVAQWWLQGTWPSKLEVGALKSGTADLLIETVTFTAESVQRVAP